MPVSQWKLAWLVPNLGILWILVCSSWLCGSIVANPIIYRLVPRPSRYEIRQCCVACVVHRESLGCLWFDGPPLPPSWSLDASETGESTKCPWVKAVGVIAWGEGAKNFFRSLCPPPPLPTGTLYSPQFRSHQDTKMAARQNQRSTSAISRKNRGLWTVYIKIETYTFSTLHALQAYNVFFCLWIYISGTGNEGWFDPWSLLNAFKRKAVSLGVEYITGEAVDFDTDQNGQINSIQVRIITRIPTFKNLLIIYKEIQKKWMFNECL